jgi:hypothetical protein
MERKNAAVALSNTGVTLLERHSYHDAIATLRDALCLIRAAGDEKLPLKEDDIQSALRRASYCLARSFPIDERKRSVALKLKVLSDYQTRPIDVLRDIQEAENIAIRIDDCRYDDSVNSMQSETSIMIFNYVTACRCLQSAGQKPIGTTLNEAYTFLYKAYAILSRQFMSALQHADEIEISRMLILAMLVLHSLMKLCDQLEMTVQYSNFRVKFDSISETISRVNSTTCWGYSHIAPAA